jgi:hypothetical protein
MNDASIGEFTLPPADALVYKDLPFFMTCGPNDPNDKNSAETYSLDYIGMEQR